MDDELTPQQSERVRRLLAEARHDEPMPDDVAARLDRVIADLADDPGARPAADAPVVRLDERRRRAGRLLLAAAVVVVGGVAVGQTLGGGAQSGDEASRPAAGQAEDQGLRAPERDQASIGGDAEQAVPGDGAGSGPGAVSETRRSISKLPAQRVRSDRFASDAERLRPFATGRRSVRDGALAAAPQTGSTDLDGCSPGVWGGGRYVRVSFDREAGWLVYRPPQGATQVVDLFLCGDDTAERSATLPFE